MKRGSKQCRCAPPRACTSQATKILAIPVMKRVSAVGSVARFSSWSTCFEACRRRTVHDHRRKRLKRRDASCVQAAAHKGALRSRDVSAPARQGMRAAGIRATERLATEAVRPEKAHALHRGTTLCRHKNAHNGAEWLWRQTTTPSA